MNLNEYQQQALQFAVYPNNAETGYLTIAIMGECGEVANVYKKELRSGVRQTERMRDELGDIWWYIAALCSENGDLDLQTLHNATMNYERVGFATSIREHLRALIENAALLDQQQQRYSEPKDKTVFLFVRDVLKEVLWIMEEYKLSLDSVLVYNLQKLLYRKDTDTLKNHE